MTVSELAILAGRPNVELVSTDVFDTILLRDDSTETGRLAVACQRSASALGLDSRVLERLRWWLQDDSYRAVTIDRPSGDARVEMIYEVIATMLGLNSAAAETMLQIEIDADIEHLRPNRELMQLLDDISRSGRRVIAVSDTYYRSRNLEYMLRKVVGPHSVDTIYTSADLGLTKHFGLMFQAVARAEGVPAKGIVHIGDNYAADVVNARRAGWAAVHLGRADRGDLRRAARRSRDAFALARRIR